MNPFEEYVKTLESAHMEVEFFKFQKAFHTHPRIIILGNGGSNSVASHISQDYMKFHGKKVSVLSDPSMITMSPLLNLDVAISTPTIHGSPYSLATTAPWEIRPPSSVITPPSNGK